VNVVTITSDSLLRRVVDVLVAIVILALLGPLLIVVSLIVVIDSPGPVIYAQERVGRNGRGFRMWKFRSMVAEADQVGPLVTGCRDVRITRVGRYLRRTKLDELPQLVNVLRGQMTLIGPRAEVARYVAHYSASDPDDDYVSRHLHAKLALDLAYLQKRTVAKDLVLIILTFGVVLRALLRGPQLRSKASQLGRPPEAPDPRVDVVSASRGVAPEEGDRLDPGSAGVEVSPEALPSLGQSP
jgi:lipopolysaccharide/colanic/teichoic acid biosynthesis glycosyltransferase